MANKIFLSQIRITPEVSSKAYLEVSTDGGVTFTIVDSMDIAASENPAPSFYDFLNPPTIDIDNPQLRVKVRVQPNYTTTTTTTRNPNEGDIEVFAGEDIYSDENVSTANFYGTVTINNPSLTIASYQWSVVTAGVTGVSFSNPNGINTGVTGIPVAARTTYRLTVTDQFGGHYWDDIDVSVARPSEMFSSGGYLDNLYDPDDQNMRTWIYLPQGYDALKPGGFPLILFMHGMGTNGDNTTPTDDINALLNTETSLPQFLYNKTYPMKCVVVMPQLHTGQWTLATAQKALNWAISGYNIDPNRAYATGFSSGGAGTMEITLGNPALFAGGIPANSTWNNAGTPGNGAGVKDIPFLFVHSFNDTSVPPASDNSTFEDIDSILAATPQGTYPPLVLMAWDTPHDYKSWGYHIYDKSMAPFDFEDDFFLFHSKNITVTCNNYVTKAETTKKFYDWSRAVVMVDKMTAGQPKTDFEARLATLKTQITSAIGHNYYMMNLGSNSTFNLYSINNITSSANGHTVNNLRDINGSNSNYSFVVVSNPNGIETAGLNHTYMGMSGDMFKSSFSYTAANPAQWKITGLDPNKYYDISLYNSNASKQMFSTNNMSGTRVLVNGNMSQSRLEAYNTLFTTDLFNVQPNGSGELIFDLSPIDNYQMGTNAKYKGNTVAVLLKEKTTTANPRTNFGKFNMANTGIASHSDWATLLGDPTAAVQSATDPVSGWVINTVNTGSDYWQNAGSNYGNDNEAPGAFAGILPDVVGKSARLNNNVYFNKDNPKYNLEVIGVPGMGFPAGTYNVKIFCATQYDFSPTKVFCKIGSRNGLHENTVVSKNNLTNYLSYTGNLKDGETIKIAIMMPNVWGYAFVNAVIVEKVG